MVLAPLVAAIGLAAMTALPVTADAGGGCVSHNEYDSLDWGLSTEQVGNRFETNGWFIATGSDFFKRGYDTCWDDTRKVVVWYSLDNGLSDHWDVRDK